MKDIKKISMMKKKIYQLVGEYYKLTHPECFEKQLGKKELVVIEHGSEPFLVVFTEE